MYLSCKCYTIHVDTNTPAYSASDKEKSFITLKTIKVSIKTKQSIIGENKNKHFIVEIINLSGASTYVVLTTNIRLGLSGTNTLAFYGYL